LLDVPCSNTGVLARRPEVRYRLRQQHIHSLCRTQRGLLNKAVTWGKPGARIVYSTCSILPEENEVLIRAFVAEHPHMHLQHEQLTFPQTGPQDHDGGYIAVLECRGRA
jgi:16S rRNA (cytosine967-C5)-methyltransferase